MKIGDKVHIIKSKYSGTVRSIKSATTPSGVLLEIELKNTERVWVFEKRVKLIEEA